jgi:hypothetical protein
MKKNIGIWALVFLFVSFLGPSFANDDVIVGMLEYTKGDRASSQFYVRILFKKSGTEWVLFNNNDENHDYLQSITKIYPPKINWTITFDGKKLDELVGVTPERFKYISSIGCQNLAFDANVPTVGKPTKEFATWTDDEVYRPLVAVSKPFFKDPEKWKPLKTTDKDLLRRLKVEVRKSSPTCECSEYDDGETPCRPVKYSDDQILLEKQYQSDRGWKLAKLRLKCAERFNQPNYMYAISPTGSVIKLGRGLTLVDVGDYDNDGRSELIFFKGDYNQDEYLIYYDDFSKRTTFGWNYH